MSKECTRSHPHELMDCCCEHKTTTARLQNELAHAQAEIDRAREALIFEWAKSAEGCWLSDVVNVRHEAAARYEREIGYE